MRILRNVGLLILGLILSILFAYPSYSIYNQVYFSPIDGFFAVYDVLARYLVGIVFAYLFFLFLLFTAFGGTKKHWWMGIAAVPALLFLAYFDFSRLYFHLLFPLAGWGIGYGISRLIHNHP